MLLWIKCLEAKMDSFVSFARAADLHGDSVCAYHLVDGLQPILLEWGFRYEVCRPGEFRGHVFG